MKNAQNKQYVEEITFLLNKLEEYLATVSNQAEKEQLNELYALCHSIDQAAGLYGLNSISGLFSIIEKALSSMVENGGSLTDTQAGVILSAVSVTHAIINDPSLKKNNLKTNYDNLKKEIEKTFATSVDDNSDSGFSNKRFQAIFIDEANDLINQLEEKLLQLESETSDLELVDNIFRIMHTLKGNSNMFGFQYLGEITHHLENVYDAIRSEKLVVNRAILDTTLQCIDHFRNLIEDVDLADSENKGVQESILNNIAQILGTEGDKSKEIEIPIVNADSNDLKTFYLFFKPEPNIFDDGSNPLYFIYDLYDLGTCKAIPLSENLPALSDFKTDRCYTHWHIVLATTEPKDVISDNFMFLRDESQPKVELLGKGNMLENEEFLAKFKKEALHHESIAAKLGGVGSAPKQTIKKESVQVKKSKSTDSSIASIRVASAKIDLMMNLISELVTKQAELSMLSNQNENTQLQEVAESIESISRDLRDNAFSISLIPLEKSVLRFQRLVRDVSTKFNKKVDFIVEGKETELDKTIIEKIVDPIMHILRNSIDHGIETPEERLALGKPETGTITLKAYPSGAHVVIEISDDGSGINVNKVHKAAIRKGYISGTEDFSRDEMLKLILSPGFSTAENISEVSGRGVGMDVVNQKINEIRGELDIQTAENKGTTITIKLPLTISIIDSLLVMIGDTYYLIPLSVVERCAEVTTPTITESPTQYLDLEGEFIPFIDLHKEFDVQEDRLSYQRLILVNHKNIVVALIVDQIMGNHQAVLKSLGQAYRQQEIISGASILGNGEVALVLDTNKLVQEFMSNREEELNTMNQQNSKAVVQNE
jgi:two-component system chemotaxis sensor kinase CheA